MDLFTGLIYGFIVALAYGVGEFVGIRKREREIAAKICLLYTSPSPRDRTRSRMPSSA